MPQILSMHLMGEVISRLFHILAMVINNIQAVDMGV